MEDGNQKTPQTLAIRMFGEFSIRYGGRELAGNIGRSKKEEPISVTISKIIGKILNTASSTVVSSKISDLKGVAQKNLEDIAGGVKDRVKSIGIFGK